MDNNDLQFDKAKFNAVWQRIMPGTEDIGQLRRFMDDEASDAQIYCMLASMCSGSSRQTLLRISSDERYHLKKLRAQHFILTGETYKPPSTCPLIYSVPDTLRRKYTGEKEGSAAYRAGAEKTLNKDLADTYLAFSEDEAHHSRMIGCIIENLL